MSEQEFEISEQEFQAFQTLVHNVEAAKTNNFYELITLLGRDIKKDFIGADLSGVDLSNGELAHANLSGADLSSANLSNVVLRDADLSGAILDHANLSRADLSSAILRDADLSSAILRDADLSCASLSRAILCSADLSAANLSRASLNDANLSGAYLSGTNLDGAIINGTQFGNNLGLSDTAKLDLKSRGALFNTSTNHLFALTALEEVKHESKTSRRSGTDSTSQAAEGRESSTGQETSISTGGVNLALQPETIRHLPQRVTGRLEANDIGILRVVIGGTSWRFRLRVSMGQIIQLVPGQTVTIVGVEDTSTLIIEV